MSWNKGSKVRNHAVANGYRSGLEETIANQLKQLQQKYDFTFTYEKEIIEYWKPKRGQTCHSCGVDVRTDHRYTPDFCITLPDDSWFYIESKGRFMSQDRTKHKLIHQQRPEIDIRWIFSRSATKLKKGSKTTYAQWVMKSLNVPMDNITDKLFDERWLIT